MNYSFGTLSHGTGIIIYALVSLLLMRSYLRRNSDRAILLACFVTLIWMISLTAQSVTGYPSFHIRYAIEILRNLSWIFVLLSIFSFIESDEPKKLTTVHIRIGIVLFYGVIFVAILIEGISGVPLINGKVLLTTQIASSTIGLMLLEQSWRNSSTYGRSSVKYLCIAICSIFVYDFLMYSDALLFGQISNAIWDARGAVNTFVAPLIAVTMVNTRKQPVSVQVSRQMVFHTGTLFLAGIYLLAISTGGYYVKAFGGTWGEALQTVFFFCAFILMVLLIGSRSFRARLMIFISKNFFDYKYDYREEWLKSTNLLVDSVEKTPLKERVIQVMAGLVESHSGALWLESETAGYSAQSYYNSRPIRNNHIEPASELVSFFKQNNWIIDLKEYFTDPTKYQLLEIPDCISKMDHPWLIVPLYNHNRVFGFTVINEPVTKVELNWENYDLIKVVASQACSFLAQSQYQDELAQAQQFEAVNRTSAFMVHDLKTIIAQLSLLTKNANKYKSNPAFIEDMIKTTEHTVDKMQHLLQQIRNPTIQHELQTIDLVALLKSLCEAHQKYKPAPQLECNEKNVQVKADYEQLFTVVGHILQNAQDATPKDGEVNVSLKKAKGMAYIFIQDNGAGMTEDFIREQLFKPFVSTKGLTGMGIGAYQSREYLKKIGGNIEVTSEPKVGTCFTLHVPIDFRHT